MIEGIEALAAFERHKTMAMAGTFLRLEPSSVWKRIKALEIQTGTTLLIRRGRSAILSPEAKVLLENLSPHLLAIRELLDGSQSKLKETLIIAELRLGFSESILMSWGGDFLVKLRQQLPQTHLQPFSHRGPLVLEKLRQGEFHAVICVGESTSYKDLAGLDLAPDEMVIVKAVPISSRKLKGPRILMGIEESSLTYPLTARALRDWMKSEKSYQYEALQSYSAIVALVKAGWGDAVLPKSVAKASGLKIAESLNCQRPLSLYCRKNFYNSPAGAALIQCAKARS
jgi:DNA-binding transcriptional LysR family regulator